MPDHAADLVGVVEALSRFDRPNDVWLSLVGAKHRGRGSRASRSHLSPLGWKTAGVVLVVSLAACLHEGRDRTDSDPSKPVAECVEYERTLSACVHSELSFAQRPDAIPKTRAERERLALQCSSSLVRLKRACR